MAFSFSSFLEGISAAIVVKLTSSADDVVWLSAFLTPKLGRHQRTKNAMTYALVCLLQTCLAFILSTSGEMGMERLMGDEQLMSPDRILTLLSGSALFVYSIVLGVEYYKENYRGDNDQGQYATIEMADGTDSENSDTITMSGQCTSETEPLEIEDGSDDKDIDAQEPHSDKESRSLAVIAFLGSLDDLTLFVPMLVGKTFGILELIIGAMVSTLAIILICLFLTQCQLVSNVLEKVPLVAIVTTFCVVLLVKGLFFMD